MKIFFCILYVIFFLSEQGFCTFYRCKDITSNAPLQVLKGYLFCNYDPNVRPTMNHRNATVVDFGLQIMQFEVDEYSSTVYFDVLVEMIWTDNHLTWNASRYNNINNLQVMSYELWIPDIVLHSESVAEIDTEMPTVPCLLESNGVVFYTPTVTYMTYCDSDHTWWPYDVMDCYIRLASWSHSINEIEMKSDELGKYERIETLKNEEWIVIEVSLDNLIVDSKFGTGFSSQLCSYHVVLKRFSTMYSASYVTTAIVLMTMTVIVLWLEPMSKERMVVANLNFVLHLLCMLDLHWKLPFNGSQTPKLILFYEKSLVLAVFSLMLTLVLRYLQKLTIDAPKWISSATITIFKSRVGQVFLVSILDPKVSARIELNSDDNTNLVSLEKRESTWRSTSVLIGWFAFLIVLFIYIIMLILYLPTSTSGNPFTLKV